MVRQVATIRAAPRHDRRAKAAPSAQRLARRAARESRRPDAPLASRDDQTRRSILRRRRELALATRDAALAACDSDALGTRIHGDLLATNLVSRAGQLTGVIDFGCLGVGDPVCDVMAAWTTLDHATRGALGDEVGLGEATWTRGRGRALSFCVIALAHFRTTKRRAGLIARHAIREALVDFKRG